MSFLPENMRASQRRMAAEVDLDRRREPAQLVAVLFLVKEGGLRQVHLASHVLQPAGIARLGKDANGGGIARERAIGEGVNLNDRDRHRLLRLDSWNGTHSRFRQSGTNFRSTKRRHYFSKSRMGRTGSLAKLG